ncbi:hypothetical protein [Tunturiibacter gelidoferens]|uniref:Uncharacterized protein n=1 Tax=Tunturiibacter gelidiferens TaxID=3069689 RepID=A0A9X0QAH1_9BACT|nr:hypothetical protein [Edaphobacter lichenicola]MBB5326698.1 hypothetical protein [Edaphobacter lichenicola]
MNPLFFAYALFFSMNFFPHYFHLFSHHTLNILFRRLLHTEAI